MEMECGPVNDGLDVLVTPGPGGMMHDLCGYRDCYMHCPHLLFLSTSLILRYYCCCC